MRRIVLIIVLVSLSVLAQEVVFEDGFENLPPIITSEPVITGRVDELYLYDVDALDPEGDTLLYLLTSSPAGMTMSPTSGVISWTPGSSGQFLVEIDVSNTSNRSATQSWMITVEEAIDTDSDGLSDVRESQYGTDPDDPDSDDDGLDDGDEVFTHGTNPLDGDTDFDGLGDQEEVVTHSTDPLHADTDGDMFGDGVEIIAGTNPLDPEDFPAGPPDPAAIAPPIDPSVAANLYDTTEFLWNGTPAIQTGVMEGTIDPLRAAVLRGYVMDRDGLPLPGAVVTINNHPEFGQTLSRADGRFDLVVNGGGPLTVDFDHVGYLPGQRRVHVEWRSWHTVPDMALVPLDAQVTAVDLTLAMDMQVAQGSQMTDSDGTRQATVLFPQGTTAMMRMPDDSMVPITHLGVRATEYTVGDNGPAAMSGQLPPDSAYTYAVELSVDEAMQAGAEAVEFDNPIPFYVDNFLGFPAGTDVPSGYYDRDMGRWVASDNGLVIDILDEAGGLATLDLDGSGTPADSEALTAAGITDAEREQVANLYDPGDSIWRVPIGHFSSWDSNWGFSPPLDATPPMQPSPVTDRPVESGTCKTRSSIIDCHNQTLGERVPIAGTPLTLNYRSNRTAGNTAKNSIAISLSGSSVPASLYGIGLDVTVAGQTHLYDFPPDPNQTLNFVWNGKDPYGRSLNGAQPLRVEIRYEYEGVYGKTVRFGYKGNGTVIEGSKTRQVLWLPEEHYAFVGSLDAKGHHLGGWSLNQQHSYDVNRAILYRGDGSQRSAEAIAPVVSTSAGTGDDGYSGDGGPANQAQLDRVYGVATGPDGTVYIADLENHRVRHVDHNGIITTFAGTGNPGWNGDNIPATSANVTWPRGLAFGPDGSLYIAEDGGERIRRVDADGIITTVAGIGETGFSGDGGPATEAEIAGPEKIAFGPDGDLYIADSENERVRRVDSAGIISTVAGNGNHGYNGDGIPAVDAELSDPSGVAIDDAGNLYISDSTNYRIRRVGPDGIITTFAGTGVQGFNGDGQPATDTQLGQPAGITFDFAGNLYIADDHNQRIRVVTPDGILTTVAGSGPTGQDNYESSGDGGPATAARLTRPEDVAVGPDGRMHIAEFVGYRVRTVERAMPGFSATDLLVPSSDGSEVYRFDAAGKHLQTLHALTGAVLLEFGYDAEGRLETVTDGDGNATTIQRDGSGDPTAIVAPFGQTTTLVLNANGFLETVANPEEESFLIRSTAGGLITQTTNPRGRVSTYGYDAQGRLTSQSDNAGQSQTFERAATPGGFGVTRTTGLGRSFHYDVEPLPGVLQTNTNTAANGSQSSVQFQTLTGTTTATSATGVTAAISNSPDPRFGMQTPILNEIDISVPAGPTLQMSSTNEVELSNSDDPFSIVTSTAESTIAGRTMNLTYTGASRTLTINTPGGRTITMGIDALGRLESWQLGDLAPASVTFDEAGRVDSFRIGFQPDVRIFTYAYGPDGLVETITDPMMRTVSLIRDAVGRVTSRTDPDGSSVIYGIDSSGQLDSITPPGQPAHTFAYTLHGQLQSVIPPDIPGTGATVFSYNGDLQPTSIARPGNEEITWDYDDNGLVDTVTFLEDGSATATYSYSYVVDDQVDSIMGPGSQVIAYSYLGHLVTSQTWSGPVSGEVSWTYDNAFRVIGESVAGGTPVAFTYDDDDFLTSAGDFAIVRAAANTLPQSASIGLVQENWTHNDFGEVEQYTAMANASTLYAADYTRDDIGRVSQKAETIGGVTDTYDFEYDLQGQLMEVRKNGVVVESYTYDANGNRLSGTVGGVTSNGTYDDQDRLTNYGSANYVYTPAGRLESRTEPGPLVTTYDYDVMGNLLSVTLPDASSIAYGLDGLDRRVERIVNGSTTYRMIYDGILPIAELDGMNNIVSQFVYAGSHAPAYMIHGGVSYRIITDQVGSVRLVVDSTTGTVAQRIDYDAFGNVTMDTNPGFQPFGFAGGLYDPLTGLVRFGSRDYDPATGRWTAKDPSGFGGGDSNLYRYVFNQPISLVDVAGSEGDDTDYYSLAWEWFEELFGDSEVGEKGKKIKKPVDKAKKYLDKSQEYLDKGLEIKEIWEDPQLNRPQRGRDIIQCFEDIAQDIVDTFEDGIPILKALDVTPYFEAFGEYTSWSELGSRRAHSVDTLNGTIDEDLMFTPIPEEQY